MKKSNNTTVAFSLYETAKPKFNSTQIRISAKPRTNAGLPKNSQKLAVGRSGKIGFTK